MRFVTLLALAPYVLSIPATRREADNSLDEMPLSLQPTSATCHDPQTKEACPNFNSVMLMCCEQSEHHDDHVEACKRMMIDTDECGGQITMQSTLERCCSFQWSCSGNGWCGSRNDSLSELKKMSEQNFNVPVVVVTDGVDGDSKPGAWNGFTNCVSLTKSATDDWCSITCAKGDYCPKTICKCNGAARSTPRVSPLKSARVAQSCVSITERVTDEWCTATCVKGVVAKASSTCPPELCTCGNSAQRKLAQSAVTPNSGEEALRIATKAAEAANKAAQAGWQAVATENAVAQEEELVRKEGMNNASAWRVPSVNWAKDAAEKTAEVAAREKKVREAQDQRDERKSAAAAAAAAKSGKPCMSLIPSMPHAWCTNTCSRGNCPSSVCECGDHVAGLQRLQRQKGTPSPSPSPSPEEPTASCQSILPTSVTDAWCTATCLTGTICPPALCKCNDAFWESARMPKPSPAALSPQPPPNTRTNCKSIAADATDAWCTATCETSICPEFKCKCDHGGVTAGSSVAAGSAQATEHSAYYMCKFFGEQCDAKNATVADADKVFRSDNKSSNSTEAQPWTWHEGSLNCYEGYGAPEAPWQAHLSDVDLWACKTACSEVSGCRCMLTVLAWWCHSLLPHAWGARVRNRAAALRTLEARRRFPGPSDSM